jgi:hypothetical protein
MHVQYGFLYSTLSSPLITGFRFTTVCPLIFPDLVIKYNSFYLSLDEYIIILLVQLFNEFILIGLW